MHCLSWRCRTASCVPRASPSKASLPASLCLVAALANVSGIWALWLDSQDWKDAFEGFLAVKPPTAADLAALVPAIGLSDLNRTDLGDELAGGGSMQCKEACAEMQQALAAVSDMQFSLICRMVATAGPKDCTLPAKLLHSR